MKSIMEEASTISKAIESAWNRAGQPQEFTVKILEHPKTSFFGLKTSKSAKIAFFFNELTVKVKESADAKAMADRQQKYARPITPRQTQPSRTSEQSEQRGQQQRRPHHQQRTDRTSEGRSTFGDGRQQPRDHQRPQAPRADRPDYKQQAQQRPERQDHSFAKHGTEKPSDSRQGFPSRPHHESINNNNQIDEQSRNVSREPARHERQESSFTRAAEERSEHNEGRRFERSQTPRYQDENRDTWAPEMVDTAHDWVKETLVMMGKPDIIVTPYVSHNYLKLTLDQSVADDSRQEEIQLKSWGNLAMEAVREKTQKPLRSLRIILESKR